MHPCASELDDVVAKGAPLCFVEEAEVAGADADAAAIDLDAIRPDLAEVIARHAVCLDADRPEAVAEAHRKTSAPHGRTSKTSAIPAASSNTAPCAGGPAQEAPG